MTLCLKPDEEVIGDLKGTRVFEDYYLVGFLVAFFIGSTFLGRKRGL